MKVEVLFYKIKKIVCLRSFGPYFKINNFKGSNLIKASSTLNSGSSGLFYFAANPLLMLLEF